MIQFAIRATLHKEGFFEKFSKGEIDANAFACIAIAEIFGKVATRTYKNDESIITKKSKSTD